MTMQEQDHIIRVRNADDMGYEMFSKHMTYRHHDSLGGFHVMPGYISDYVEDCWRAYHDTLHRLGLQKEMDHEHGR